MGAVEQGSAEWLEQRKGKISGTSAGVIEQCNPYQKPADLVRSMVRDLAGAPSEFNGGPAVAHGQMMESVAKEWYERAFNTTVDETDFVVHPMYEFLGASPDGLVGLDGSIEIKCPYPRYTKAPYSVWDAKKKMYLRQCQLVMEVLDVDWLDFLCYLSPNADAEPEYNIERIHREEGWLHEPLPKALLPKPAKGTIPRIDLYVEWHEYIHSEFNDLSRRKIHTDAAQDMYEVVKSEEMETLSKAMVRLSELRTEHAVILAEILGHENVVNDMKKVVADKYASKNVTDGVIQVQCISRKPSFDFRKGFEAIGGEAALLSNGHELEDFRSTSNTRQIKVKMGD